MNSRPVALRAAVLVTGLASLALLAAGCGGSSSLHVANVGTTTAAAPVTPPGGTVVASAAQGVAYSTCMRVHGVTSFPDPSSKGAIHLVGIDPTSPTFEAAQNACHKLSPKGGPPTPAQQAQEQQELLAFSRCMRTHGIADFPDPTNGHFELNGGQGNDLRPTDPQFVKAQRVCGEGHVFMGSGTVRIH
jgi:hypothetical protein